MTDTPIPQSLALYPTIGHWVAFKRPGSIEVRTGKVEIGQGLLTALTQIAADELDVSPERIRIVSGDTRSSPNEGYTAGSLSTEMAGANIRLATSAARQLFVMAAAARSRHRAQDISIRDGSFHAGDTALGLDYWMLAETLDLSVPIADHSRPKPTANLRWVGRALPRVDLRAKLGGAPFIHDLEFPDLLHGRALHPPSLHARLQSIDAGGLPGGVQLVRDGGFVGVLARREEIALAAMRKLAKAARWNHPVDNDFDPERAIAQTDAAPETSHVAGVRPNSSTRRFEAVYARPFLSHGSIGPSCALARWVEGRLEVWSHTQGPVPLQQALARVFEMDAAAIDVIHAPGAGCYGHNGADDVALDAALLARAVPGRIVRVVWSREDELTAAPFGAAMMSHVSAELDAGGRIVAFSAEIRSPPHTSRPGWGDSPNLISALQLSKATHWQPLGDVPIKFGGGADRNAIPEYDFGHVTIAKRIARVPVRTSSLRTLGGFLNVFATESFVDEIAAAVDADPVQFRLAHLPDARAREVIERAVAMSPWPGPKGEGVALGLAFARYAGHGAYCAVIVEVELDEAIRVRRAWAAVDAGLSVNPDGVRSQVEGGIVQAVSWTLKEKVVFEGASAVARDWESYPILTFPEAPEIEVEVIQRLDEPSLGAGEASSGPAGAAIANAVWRAVGARIRDLPLTRERIVAALS